MSGCVEIDIKEGEWVYVCGLHSAVSQHHKIADRYENDNESFNLVKCRKFLDRLRKFLDQLRKFRFVKKESPS
jgi:hypothetical protein